MYIHTNIQFMYPIINNNNVMNCAHQPNNSLSLSQKKEKIIVKPFWLESPRS